MTFSGTVEIHRSVVADGQPAIDAIGSLERLTAPEVTACFANGAVWMQSSGKPRRLYDPVKKLRSGQQLHLYCNDSTLTPCPYRPGLVSDFGDFSIWFKPAGMLSQGSKWGDHWTLQRWIHLHHWPQRRCLITHRLDRFTHGLMIVAHDDATNRQFHRQFEQRNIGKTYRAVVNAVVQAGKQWDIDSPVNQKSALSRVKVLACNPGRGQSLLQIKPVTGRKHQIRIHLSEAGLPILNDRQYGQAPFDDDIALQACALEFCNPMNGERLSISLDNDKLLALNDDPGT